MCINLRRTSNRLPHFNNNSGEDFENVAEKGENAGHKIFYITQKKLHAYDT